MLSVFDSSVSSLVDAIDEFLFEPVENGSEDDLFIASYLHGHFSVVAAGVADDHQSPLSAMDEGMKSSLEKAFSNNEVTLEDAEKVSALWRKVVTKFS